MFFKNVCDMSTLATVHWNIINLGLVFLDAAFVNVEVTIYTMGLAVKPKAKSKPRTHKQTATEDAFKALKHAVYHEINEELLPRTQGPSRDALAALMVSTGSAADIEDALAQLETQAQEWAQDPRLHYSCGGEQTGQWTAAASDLMRRDRSSLVKFHEMRMLAEAVMGSADYHPNPCVLICPFATCRKSHYHLNGFSTVSQLYSHWQQNHAKNKAARTLE